jgi:hypothetical protein
VQLALPVEFTLDGRLRGTLGAGQGDYFQLEHTDGEYARRIVNPHEPGAPAVGDAIEVRGAVRAGDLRFITARDSDSDHTDFFVPLVTVSREEPGPCEVVAVEGLDTETRRSHISPG